MSQRVVTHKRSKPSRTTAQAGRKDAYDWAEQFLRSSGARCATPEQAFGRCYDISERFMDYLEERKVDARLVYLKGFTKKLGAGAVVRWQITHKRDLVHHVVLIDDTVVDLTGSQFGYEYGDITYPLDVLKERWKIVRVYGGDGEYMKGTPEEDVF